VMFWARNSRSAKLHWGRVTRVMEEFSASLF
jgi:hypothetical protein